MRVLFLSLLTIQACFGRTVQPAADRTIYLTFDDGPGDGTPHVLDVLKQYGVRGTFFINGQNLDNGVTENEDYLLRTLNEGHVVADHSYNHMLHNNKKDTPRNAYLDVETDVKYFGAKNSNPVINVLRKKGFSEYEIFEIVDKMESLIRLPYTNNWRVGDVYHDCFACTIPEYSARNGIKLADLLEAQGKQVIGWDIDWRMNYTISRYVDSGSTTMTRVDEIVSSNKTKPRTRLPGKVVVLSHDVAHRPGSGSYLNGVEELSSFIRLALDSGYNFDTLDNYINQ